jgi:hypothetical protein
LTPVITEFIINNKKNNQRCTYTDRQAKHIDDGKSFIAPEIARGDYKMIFKH